MSPGLREAKPAMMTGARRMMQPLPAESVRGSLTEMSASRDSRKPSIAAATCAPISKHFPVEERRPLNRQSA